MKTRKAIRLENCFLSCFSNGSKMKAHPLFKTRGNFLIVKNAAIAVLKDYGLKDDELEILNADANNEFVCKVKRKRPLGKII